MTERIQVDGIDITLTHKGFAQGGQGIVHKGHLTADPNIKLAIKDMQSSPATEARARALCTFNLAQQSPGIAAPLAHEVLPNGQLRSLALFVEGGELHDDIPRSLPECLEIALETVCHLELLEEVGIGHGDIAYSNILIAPDGAVSLIDLDGFTHNDPQIPAPLTLGQRPMLAPELRAANAGHPTPESDRFAIAVFLSHLLLGRYPTDGLGDTPAAVDHAMTQGDWPEHRRPLAANELSIDLLGPNLINLFDRAFSLTPSSRPTMQEWRKTLTTALNNCWIHSCGNAFIADQATSSCPACNQSITLPAPTPKQQRLKIVLTETGLKLAAPLVDRQPIILGRSAIPGLPATISANHLEIHPNGQDILPRHTGNNPTLIRRKGTWYQLDDLWVTVSELGKPLDLQLAETAIALSVE